jgi:hypothetical protein
MAEIADRVMELLCSGLSQKVTAETVGCTEGYVSQLMDIPAFKETVLAKKAEQAQRYIRMDNKMDELEDIALNRMKQVIQTCFKPLELSTIHSRLNAAKRRSVGAAQAQGKANTVVNIIMPAAMRERYGVVVDVNNRVVRIGSDTMVPASASTVHRMAEERRDTYDGNSRELEDNSAANGRSVRTSGTLTVEDF